MIKHFCDICGKESCSIVRMGFMPLDKSLRSLFYAQSWNADLCEKCRLQMLGFIKEEARKCHE